LGAVVTAPLLRLVPTPPTDDATKAWEASRPANPPKLSPEFRAIVETADAARGGVDTLIDALRDALQLAYERDNYDDLCAELADAESECKKALESAEELEKERDTLQQELDRLAKEDARLAEAKSAREEASAAESRLSNTVSMVGRLKSDLATMTDRALLAEGRYKDLGEAYRSIIGDDPGASLLATYWHGQTKANAAELIALRRFVNEVETQRAKRRKKP
jgi:DNA repair exonuclease SbcCD ATPase subunit